MSTQEEQEIIKKWQERFATISQTNDPWELQYIASQVKQDAEKHPQTARQLVNMTLEAINTPQAKEITVYHDFERSLADSMIESNTTEILEMGKLDSRIFTDFLNFKIKNNYNNGLYTEDITSTLVPAVEEGNLSAKLLYESVKQMIEIPSEPVAKDDYYTQKYFRNRIHILSECVAQDPTLAKDFIKIAQGLENTNVDTTKLAYAKLSKHLDKMPAEMTDWLAQNIEKSANDHWFSQDNEMREAMFNIVRQDTRYLPQYQKLFYSPVTERNAIFVAKIYENLKQKEQDNNSAGAYAKNSSTKILTSQEEEIAKACENLLKEYECRNALKVKIAKDYPMSAEALGVEDNNYINMCVNNLEHPEKENIRSILNRLEATEAKSYEDFAAAVDFVRRRDKFRKMCQEFNDEKTQANPRLTEYEKQQYKKDKISMQYVSEGQLSYGMAEAGIRSQEDASKVIKLFYEMNRRPETYGSEYNNFYPSTLKEMTNLEEWMYPIIKQAVRSEVVDPNRLGGGKDLFAACKAWNINPRMPKAIAEQIGEMSLARRMVAGAIVDDMGREQVRLHYKDAPHLQPDYWLIEDPLYFPRMNHNKELIPEFWKEMSKAQEMSFGEAMKTYVPDTPINRKRFVAAMLEEMGVENTEAKYQQTYKNLEENGKFEEFLASDSKEDRLERVEKIKQNKAKVQEKSTKERSARETIRERLAKRGILPETGKHGEGHKIKIPSKDMSQFKTFVDETTR